MMEAGATQQRGLYSIPLASGGNTATGAMRQKRLPAFMSAGNGGRPPSAAAPNTNTATATSNSSGGGGGGSTRQQQQRRRRTPSQAAIAAAVATDLLVNDKAFATPAPPQTMAVSRHVIWLSYADGGCEIRNVRTAEVVKRFSTVGGAGATAAAAAPAAPSISSVAAAATATPSAPPVVVRAMLGVMTRAGEPQVWLGLSNGTVEVHHSESGELLATLRKHLGGVSALAEFGGYIYSGGQDQQIVQWRLEGCRYVRAFMGGGGHDGGILVLYAEGNALVSGAADDTVKVWDVGSGAMQLTGYFHSQSGGVTALCRVGEVMWSGDNAGQLARWALRTCEALDISTPHTARITQLKRAGARVYSSSADGTIGILCADTGRLLKRVEDQAQGQVTCVACPAELSRFVVWSADADGRVQCWYQDEYTFMSRDHEQLNEPGWYRSGSTPYAEFRRAIGHRNAQLREQLASAELRDARAMAILRRCSPVLGGGGREVSRQYARLQDQRRMVEDRRTTAVVDLQKARDELAQVERDLAATLTMLTASRGELNAMSPGYGDAMSASLPNIPAAADAATAAAAAAAGTAGPSGTVGGVAGTTTTAPATTAAAPAGGVVGVGVGSPTGTTATGTVIPATGAALTVPTAPGVPTPAIPAPGVPPPLILPPGTTSAGGATAAPPAVAAGGVPLPVPLPTGSLAATSVAGAPSLPTNPMLPPPPLTAVPVPTPTPGATAAGALPIGLPVPQLGAPIAPLQPLGTISGAGPGTAVGGGGLAVPAPPPPLTTSVPGGPTQGLGALGTAPATIPVPTIGAPSSIGLPTGTTTTTAPLQGGATAAVPAGGIATTTAVPGIPGVGTPALGIGTAAAATTTTATATAAGPGAVGGVVGAGGGAGVGGVPLPAAPGSLGIGSQTGAPVQPPLGVATAPAPGTGTLGVGGAAPQTAAAAAPALSYEQQVQALLAAAAEASSKRAETEGVKWTNPNVGNYIQRRYFGASPSLRAPDIELRERRQSRVKKVAVVPLKRSPSTAAKTPKKPATAEGAEAKKEGIEKK